MKARTQGRVLPIAVLLAAVLVGLQLAFWLLPGVFEPLRYQAGDRLFALRSSLDAYRPPYDDTVVHVTIDNWSLARLPGGYVGRAEHARLISNLQRADVAAQAHDIIFAEPRDDVADSELVEAAAAAGNVYFGMALGLSSEASGAPEAVRTGDEDSLERSRWLLEVDGGLLQTTSYFLTFPKLAAAARGLGSLDVTVDRDGAYRRVPLLAQDGDRFLPSLSLRAACDYLGVTPDRLRVQPGRWITLQGAMRPGETVSRDIRIPIDRQGRIIVNFLGPWGSMRAYPFFSVYEASDDRFLMDDLRDELAGKIAVVSWVATGYGDVGSVPTDLDYPLSGIHANVIHSILTGNLLREASPVAMLLWVQLPLLALVLFAALRLPTLGFLLVPPLLTFLYVAVAAAAFLRGNLLLDIPGPILTLGASMLVIAAYQYHCESRDRAVLRHTFDAYFPPTVASKILERSEQLIHNAQKKELTILFSDIRGFTTHTSNMEAGQVRSLLNEYLERMIEIVFRHEGTLDKFIGDGLMVFFGDPQDQQDHAKRAVLAALEMQKATRELAADWQRRGEMPLEIRVGINSGDVIVGNMGSARRMEYTVLGKPVNLAQRLESNAPNGGILISQRTCELLNGSIEVKRLDPIQVKGIPEKIQVYEVPLL